MQCKNHPGESGVNTCNQCGSWLCDRCSFQRSGRIFCPHCAAQQSAPTKPDYSFATHHIDKSISWGLLFLFSVVIPLPGLNYMYMGFIKRGFVAMSAFFGAIYLTAMLGGGLSVLFAFSIPVLWITCTFDGFRMRARINAGEVIPDNIDDITSFIQRNRSILIGFLLLLLAVNLLGGILPWMLRLLRIIVPILIAVWAVQTLFKKR